MRRAPRAALGIASALLAGCGSEASDDAGDDASDREPTGIVVTATDGSQVEFTDFTVTCRPTHEDDGTSWARTVRAIGGAGGVDPFRHPKVPGMLIEADAQVDDGSTVTLPHHDKWGQMETFVSVFVTRSGAAVELSSAVEESFGEVEVVSAGCDPQPHLEVKIDATLHSEYHGGGHATAIGHVAAD